MEDLHAANSELRRKIMGYIVSQAIFVVAELGIADQLADGPAEVGQLARESNVDPQALYRFLRVLAAEGLFVEEPDGTFGLTPAGGLLRDDAPGSLRHFCDLMSGQAYQVWAQAMYSVRTGKPAFDHVFGQPYFDWIAQRPEDAAAFNKAQAGLVRLRMLPLLERDWRDTGTVVDVGGGNGELLTALLARHSHLDGVVFELPHVVAQAAPAAGDVASADRIRWIAGDFFHEVPAGADTYVLAQVLHDWDDEKAAAILGTCRRAMPAGSRMLIVDQVIPDNAAPHPGKLLDLHMLVLLGGQERTENSWRKLLDQSGFVLRSITEGARSAVLEAIPA